MICTEPHNLNITIAHAGINYFRVKVLGKTSHAGLAHLGVNAIGLMYPIYHALTELDEKRAVEVRFPLFEKGSGRSCHINIGTFHSGDWPSSVAGKAELECRIGYIPGEKMGDIKTMIEDAIHRVAESDPWLREHPPKVEWFGWQTEPWHQDPQHPFVQCFKASAEEILMREADYIGRACGIDSRFAPYFGMPSACTGPVAKNIHGIDEYVEISSVVDVTKILAATILNWCGCID
jgi:acetylornithine deacetylase